MPERIAGYCVAGDLMQWREPRSYQHLLLRRSATLESETEAEPARLH